MTVIRSGEFRGARAWAAQDIAAMNGVSVRLHWTDQPYRWHVNEGEEVFAVLQGEVEMRVREQGVEQRHLLRAGDLFHVRGGCEHVAHPIGVAHVLVIENEGSI
ncbi:cupin domain-containing protein [Inhella sp.]|uniref:cupin domain-containing protein n=1 Tax=Inhella sp. TaxID=1921806 RepID=UPI0035B2DF41